ncbi:23 kDa integral membrane protein-like [Eurosta solidaginis]|uniref:23 kDa integral membrane protein-like n=1 Tax=Eurosta solidaginis TaxID=178769 RepID=UPI00353163D7
MDCCEFFVKYLLYFFNLLTVIVGILLIVLGSVILAGMGDLKSVNNAVNVDIIPIIIIVLGAIIFIVSFFGCFGAIKEINWCVLMYTIFVFILMCLQIALVVWVFVRKNEFLNSMTSIVKNAYNNKNDQADSPMNIIQITFKCCGYNNYTDYSSTGVPASCCGYTGQSTSCPSSIYTTRKGCETAFYNFWNDNLRYVRYGGIIVIVIEFFAFIAACGLSGCIRSNRFKELIK